MRNTFQVRNLVLTLIQSIMQFSKRAHLGSFNCDHLILMIRSEKRTPYTDLCLKMLNAEPN